MGKDREWRCVCACMRVRVCGSRRARINHRYARDRSEATDLERKRDRERNGEMERRDEEPKDENGGER